MNMRSLIVIALALVALILLGYAWNGERQKNIRLTDKLEANQNELSQLRSGQQEQETAFFVQMSSDETALRLQAIANADTFTAREALAASLFETVGQFQVQFIVAEEVIGRVDMMVDATLGTERQDILNRLVAKIESMWITPPFEPELFVSAESVNELSSIVTALGGVFSALAAAFLTLTGGWKRPFEKELMGIDVETKRLELAVAQHKAREALDYAATLKSKKAGSG